MAAGEGERAIAAQPARAQPSLKLPIIPPFDNPESIIAALASRETNVLTAGLLQLEKRALALVAKPAPRSSPDPVLDYLAKYATVDGVFAAWDTAHKSNNSQLSAAVLSALSALIRLVSTDPFASEPEIIRRLLSQYGSHLDRALNPGRNDVTVAALKLCNVVVGFGSGRFARRLFGCMQWSPKIINRLFRTRLRDTSRDALSKPDIRTLLTMLVLAFLSAGDSRLKGEVIDAKGLVSGILKGLSEDPSIVVSHVLVGIYRDVISDRSVGLEARRSIFDELCIIELVKLYESTEDEDSVQSPRMSTHRFLYALTGWLALQINESQAKSFGPQKVLGAVLRTLKVTEDPQQRELGLYILQSAPILAGLFWSRFPSSLDPRLSSRWISAITFATQVVALPVSPHLALTSAASSSLSAPPSLTSVLDNVLPPSLTKVWYAKALQHENPLVSFLSSIFVLAALQKASKVLEVLADSSRQLEEVPGVGRWANLAERMREHLRMVLPDPQNVVALMQKTAPPTAAALATAAAKNKSKSSRSKAKTAAREEAMAVDEPEGANDDQAVGRHLRTNVALRLLWLYHRVVPSAIAMLRFDFAKLPQAHVEASDAEGIRAISSAYALRLAAVHSSGLTWSRPGDHFKNTLVPLFRLYRTPATPSNRRLLLSILGDLLRTSILFGSNLAEVETWLSALPIPTSQLSPDDTHVLDFFEASVQKTLTAPIRPTADGAETPVAEFSPLLTTVLADLPAALASGTGALLAFVRLLVLGFVGRASDAAFPRKLVDALGESLGKGKEIKKTRKVLLDFVVAIGEKQDVVAGSLDGETSLWSPINANVFAAVDGQEVTERDNQLATTLAAMPLELVLLHVRPSDLASPTTSTILTGLVAITGEWLITVQVLLHRYINVAWTADDRAAFATFFKGLLASCADERVQQKIKMLLFGEQGLLAAFRTSTAAFQSITELVRLLLSPSNPFDAALAIPYCSTTLADLVLAEPRRSSKSAQKIPARVLAASPLLEFFDTESAVTLASALLDRVATAPLPLDASVSAVVGAALARTSVESNTAAFRTMWTSHFVPLNRLATAGELDASAGVVLARGGQALLPFALSEAGSAIGGASLDGFRYGSNDVAWREHATEWTHELLATTSLSTNQAQVLAALIYRSPITRSLFASWVNERTAEGESGIDGAESALAALLEAGAVSGSAVAVPSKIAIHFTERLLSATADLPATSALGRVVQLMAAGSSDVANGVAELLSHRIPEIDREAFTPIVLRLVSDLAASSTSFTASLALYVNGAFAGLVRRFAEDEEDTEAVSSLVNELILVTSAHPRIEFKTHLLDPLITAAVTRRLDKTGPITLATALSRNHKWKESEVTRLLSGVFASTHFHPAATQDAAAKSHQSAISALVVALSNSALPSAASSRVVEKLMPFYGGTLSTGDALLVDLFQRIELVSGGSISVALRQWNPALDESPLESTRAANLAALQLGYARRSWLRVCASSATPFPKEHRDITYDPEFLLPFLSQTIVEDELKGPDWNALVETGALSLAVAALASSSTSARLTARVTLLQAEKKLESLAFREREEILLILAHARNCIYSQAGEAIPAVIALFLANALQMIATPESPLYPAFNRFLLQRPLLDQRDVPMFYLLFFSASDEPLEDHRWLLKFLAEGLVRSQDWKIYRRRQTFELLASLLQSSQQDPMTRKLILQFLLRATSIPQAARELLSRNGLLGWISAQVPIDAGERRLLVNIVSNIVSVMSHDKLASIADALDALAVSCSSSEVSGTELTLICTAVSSLVARLPTPATDATSHRLLLDRARDLLSFVSRGLPADKAVQATFYHTVMLVSFTRHEAHLAESRKDQELFNAGVRAGLAAEVDQLRAQTVRGLLG